MIRALLDYELSSNGINLKLVHKKRDPTTVTLTQEETTTYRRLMANDFGTPDVRFFFEPVHFSRFDPGMKNISFCQWETDKITAEDVGGSPYLNWARQFNLADRVMTSCKSAAKAYVDSGVETPVVVCPGPIFPHETNGELPLSDITVNSSGRFIKKEERPMVVAYMAYWSPRKNISGFVEDTSLALNKKDARLLLKISCKSGQEQGIIKELNRIRERLKKPDMPPMCVVTEELTDEQIMKFFNSIDLYYAPSHGECYGMPVTFAAAAGVRCLVPDWSGPTEYLPERSQVGGHFSPAIGMTNYKWNEMWYDIDRGAAIKELSKAAKEFHKDRQLFKARSEADRNTVFEAAGWKKFAETVVETIHEVANEK